MTIELTLPQLDDNVAEYTVSRWLKQAGEAVIENEPILEVETDKVTMEMVAEKSGILDSHLVEVGHVIHPGATVALLRADSVASAGVGPGVGRQTDDSPASDAPDQADSSRAMRLTPVVARMVAEHNLDVRQITGSGHQGRVTKKDVLAYLKQGSAAQSAPPAEPSLKPATTPPSPVESVEPTPPLVQPSPVSSPTPAPTSELLPLTGMRRSIAEHMVRSLHTSPHVTTVFEFDFSAVAAHRAAHKAQFAKEGLKLTYMTYLAQATVAALKRFPQVNSVWHEEGIELKPEINLGVIVAVESGLLAPVIHEADLLNLRGMAKAIAGLAERARQNALTAAEMQGGTFSISNHGAAGSLLGTPIIFQPQAGILGVGVIEERVKVVNGGLHIKPCAYISFSFDHRLMDGAIADGFVADIKRTIEEWS